MIFYALLKKRESKRENLLVKRKGYFCTCVADVTSKCKLSRLLDSQDIEC